jgi:FkbM family methyltransferase
VTFSRASVLKRCMIERVWEPPRDTSVFRRLLTGGSIQIVDVGARGGLHARWQPFSDFVEAIGFEPDAAECQRLTAEDPVGGRMRFLPYALGATRERRPFYLCRQQRCSSLYPPNARFVSVFAPTICDSMTLGGQSELDVVPLDRVAQDERVRPDCLKVDVQGAELDVLKGAAKVLATVKLMELEVEFNPQYLGQPLFADVDAFARLHGFSLLGLRRTFWRRRAAVQRAACVAGGQIVHGDALYYNERLLDAAGEDTRDLAIWLVLLGAYRQHDFILQLLTDHPAARRIDAHDRQQIVAALLWRPRAVARVVAALLSRIGPIEHHLLRQWLDAMRPPPAEDWHDPDFF